MRLERAARDGMMGAMEPAKAPLSNKELFGRCEQVLAWWLIGCIKAEEVVAWADRMIQKAGSPESLPYWLMELSLQGPEPLYRSPDRDLPRPKQMSYSEEFRARVECTNPNDDESVGRFAKWAAGAAMGEDLDAEEVRVGYAIEHAISYENSGDPIEIAREAVRAM